MERWLIQAKESGVAAHAIHMYAGNDFIDGHTIKDLPKQYQNESGSTTNDRQFIEICSAIIDTTMSIVEKTDGLISIY